MLRIVSYAICIFIALGFIAILIDLFSSPGRAIINLLIMLPEVAVVLYSLNYANTNDFIQVLFYLLSAAWNVFIVVVSFIVLILEFSGQLNICKRKDGFSTHSGFSCFIMLLIPFLMFSSMMIHGILFLYCQYVFYKSDG